MRRRVAWFRKLDVTACLRKLDEWATWVRSETDRNFHRFTDKPEQFENSEASFRMLMMIIVLQQDFGVHYNKARIRSPDYSNSQDVLIHGMIGSTNGGTCASMPVLYTAVARRLGYPVFLVLAKEHIFCRWDGYYGGQVERVNIDGAGEGGTTHPDSHYMKWPHPITKAEVDRGVYLRSLDPASTLATCLASRAYVCEDNGDLAGAHHAYAEAARRDRREGMYAVMAARFGGRKKAAPPAFVPPVDGDPAVLDAWNRQQIQRLQEQTMPQPPPPPRVQKPIPGPYDR